MDSSSQWLTFRSNDDRSSTLRTYPRSIDANTARSSYDQYPSVKRNPSGVNHLKQGTLPSRSLTALSTPHDQMLKKMYNYSTRSESVLPLPSELDVNPPPLGGDGSQTGDAHHMYFIETNTHQPTRLRSVNEPANIREGAVSETPTASFASNAFPPYRLYDPFDGSPLGIIAPMDPAGRDREDMPLSIDGNPNDGMWLHLSRVLDLQNQIARMHVDMEGVGLGKQNDGKGKGPLGNASRATGFTRQRTTSTGSVPGGDIGDEEGVGVMDEEAEKLKAREREFKKLATQFEGRKEAINDMMSKLDDLSQALTEFHSLQAPRTDFPGPLRKTSLGTSASDQIPIPVIIPPSDTTSPISPGEPSLQTSSTAMYLPNPYLQPARHDKKSNLSPYPPANTQPLRQSLGRREPVPTLINDAIEPISYAHVVDSPTSTSSLRLPNEESDKQPS